MTSTMRGDDRLSSCNAVAQHPGDGRQNLCYHACILVVLGILEGLVQELSLQGTRTSSLHRV
jgi:hypothetical protein